MSLTVTINGVDRTTSVLFDSLRKTDNLNQQVDRLSFSVRKHGGLTFVPALGDTVSLTRNGTTLFGGVVMRITENVRVAKTIMYAVECNDYSQFLKRQLVTERYENKTILEIITALRDDYTDDGFTVTNVAGGLTIGSISFNRINVADCLQKLADAVSYVWYVDYNKDIHFFPKNTEAAPFNLSDTSANYIYDSLEIVEDLTQVRNSVLVQGGEDVSSTSRTELLSGDGTRTIFPLANKFSNTPTVTVGGVAQTVGTEYLDDDASFDCLWNFNEKYLRFTSGHTPASGANNIEASGTYLFPIVVSVPSKASQAEFGTYELAITDRSIRSQAEAIDRAFAELTTYQNELHEGQFRTYTDGLRSGQVISIVSEQRNRGITVLIQSVTSIPRDPLGTSMEYTVRFATLKSIGIIEYLQNQLRSKEVIVDDQETILSFFPEEDSIGFTDSLATPTTSTGPYVWAGDGPLLVDEYPSSNASGQLFLTSAFPRGGQIMQAAEDSFLKRIQFQLYAPMGSTGTIRALVYAVTGTPGSSGLPTGDPLAVSEDFDTAELSTFVLAMHEFHFTGENVIPLEGGEYYAIELERVSATGEIRFSADNTSPTHVGNSYYFSSGGDPTADPTTDKIFSVHGEPANVAFWDYATWS